MNQDVLRILDANANRAREALRVIEDYARFALDDQAMCLALKQLRHGFTDATRGFVSNAILHRDTPGDVGTTAKTESEGVRANISDVVIAAGKRLGEALRTTEEYLKTIDPASASRIESLRYQFYDIEQKIAPTLRPAARRFDRVRLYVLLTESLCKRPWLDVAKAAIDGGADCIQLREKHLDARELLDRAGKLVEICHLNDVFCIINDRPDVALLCRADGVHLGQQDLPARDVRKMVGNEVIVGVSTHSIEQARQAVLDGADYIGVGPIFRSTTKPRDFLPGVEYARQVAQQIGIPAIAIAGIDASNVDEVLSTGIRAVAVSSAVIGREDVAAAARAIKCKLQPSENGCPKT